MLQGKSLIFGINKELCDPRDIPSLRLHNFEEIGFRLFGQKLPEMLFKLRTLVCRGMVVTISKFDAKSQVGPDCVSNEICDDRCQKQCGLISTLVIALFRTSGFTVILIHKF